MKYIISLIILWSITLSFGQAIATDRPDQTESSSSVEKGKLQIESGILLEFVGSEANSSRNLLLPTNLFRLGLSDFFEIRILSQYENNFANGKTTQGISDLEIGTKIQLYQRENAKFEAAFLSHLRTPTGSSELRNNNFASINKLCISHVVTDAFSIGYNLGYNYEGKVNNEFTYSIAFNYALSEKVAVYAEPYGFISEDFKTHFSNFDAGFTYLFQDNLQFDFSYGLGLNHYMNYLSIGMSWKSK